MNRAIGSRRVSRACSALALALCVAGRAVHAQSQPTQDAPIATTDIDDQDGDGVLDAVDRCPTTPETYNGLDDHDGCPDTRGAVDLPPSLGAMIPLVGSQRLLVRNANTILHAVVALLRAHPRIQEVTIEAHTDARGMDAFNLHLSQARADWVRAELVRLGIASTRIVARGFGEYCPLDRAANPAAWQRNRRVVFRVSRSSDPRVRVEAVGCPEATGAMGGSPK